MDGSTNPSNNKTTSYKHLYYPSHPSRNFGTRVEIDIVSRSGSRAGTSTYGVECLFDLLLLGNALRSVHFYAYVTDALESSRILQRFERDLLTMFLDSSALELLVAMNDLRFCAKTAVRGQWQMLFHRRAELRRRQ